MEHSSVRLLELASKLPIGVFSYWSGLAGFMCQKVGPTAAWSGGVISSMGEVFRANSGNANATSQDMYGVDEITGKEIGNLIATYLFDAESMEGGNDEALLLFKKVPTVSWGACEDYMDHVKTLAKSELERREGATKLRVRLYFAESDMMIGKRGQIYFSECWKQDSVSGAIDLESYELPGTDHETLVLDMKHGALRKIFEEIKQICL